MKNQAFILVLHYSCLQKELVMTQNVYILTCFLFCKIREKFEKNMFDKMHDKIDQRQKKVFIQYVFQDIPVVCVGKKSKDSNTLNFLSCQFLNASFA